MGDVLGYLLLGRASPSPLGDSDHDRGMGASTSRLERITSDPLLCHGAPTIRGMRLRAKDVLELLAAGMTYDEILQDYDELQLDDILASLEYAALYASPRLLHAST